MVKLALRMRKLKSLLTIRLGPGAAILPPEITKIHMNFAVNIHDGHYGPRKFWRNCLPRLKYHNPTVSMTVVRTNNQDGPALMTVHYASPETLSADLPLTTTASEQTPSAPVPTSTTGSPKIRIEEINMKHRTESEILDQLLKLTEAKTVKATADEVREIAEIEEAKRKAEMNAAKAAEMNEAKRREKMLLQQASNML